MTTYYATPRHGMSALVVLWWTLRFCELAGRKRIGAYLAGPDCFAVVVA